MPTITSYLYPNRITAQIVEDDPSIKTRNRVVYNRTVEVYKGLDNPITIQFKNQDQRNLNISSYSLTGYLVDIINNQIVSNIAVTVSNATIGTASVTLTEELLDQLPLQRYKLALKAVSSGLERPVYTDDNYGLYTEIKINPGLPPYNPVPDPTTLDFGSVSETTLDEVIDLGSL